MLDFFKKKRVAKTSRSNQERTSPRQDNTRQSEDIIDDISFIQDMKHTRGVWHQYDVLLAASGYGWSYMVDSAAYMASADLDDIGTLTIAEMANMPETELISEYKDAHGNLKDMPMLTIEKGQLAVGGISRVLKAPTKIVWFNQTLVIRVFTLIDDETLLKKYIETIIRRTFGTRDAMKLAKPVPEK